MQCCLINIVRHSTHITKTAAMKSIAFAVSSALFALATIAHAQEAKPGTAFRDCPTCPDMVVLPAGEFVMGSSKEESGQTDEKPQHKVSFAKPYAIGKTEVTFDQWDACTTAGKCPKASDDDLGRGSRPVINVSREEAQMYTAWLSQTTGKKYRLPSESEWEYAARGGTTTPWYWGISETSEGSPRACEYANVHDQTSREAHPMYVWSNHPCADSFAETAPVGKFKPNAYGLYDVSGNVREWVQDCHTGDYNGHPADRTAREEAKCEKRIVRGGGWIDGFQTVRSAYRHTYEGEFRGYQVGFRVVREMQ